MRSSVTCFQRRAVFGKMSSWKVVRAVFVAAICGMSASEEMKTHSKNNDKVVSLGSNEIKMMQMKFFESLKKFPELGDSRQFSNTISILNTAEGQQLARELLDSLMPTIGRPDSRELLHHFWTNLMASVSPQVSKKLKQLEDAFHEVESFPTLLDNLAKGNESSPVVQILSELFPNVNIAEMLKSFSAQTGGPQVDIVTRVLNIITPGIHKLLKDNDIDLEPDAILHILSTIAAQYQTKSDDSTNLISVEATAKTNENKKTRGDTNFLTAVLPLLGMLGQGEGRSRGKSATAANNLIENIASLLNGDSKSGGKILEDVVAMLAGGWFNADGKSGGNNMLESIISLLSARQTGAGGDNMLGLMTALLSGMGNQKKQDNNVNMMAMALDLLSNTGGRKANKKNDISGIAKMAMDIMGQMSANEKKDQKANPVKKETILNDKTRTVAANSTSLSSNQRSRLLAVLEPALLQLTANTACHAKLSGVMSAAKAMMESKGSGAKTFLSTIVPLAVSRLPGGPEVLQELSFAVDDMGLREKHLSQILASIQNEGECSALARRAAPYIGKVLLLLAEPDVQHSVMTVLGEQTAAVLEGFGLKGVTLKNWQQMLGPMINMATAGLPIQPVALLSATQEHITLLLSNVSTSLSSIRGQNLKEVTKLLEPQIGSLLHKLGATEQHLRLMEPHGSICLAHAVCRAAETEHGVRAAILTSYSTSRALMLSQESVTTRLRVLRAAASTKNCHNEFPCSASSQLEDHAHRSLDYDEAAHQEL